MWPVRASTAAWLLCQAVLTAALLTPRDHRHFVAEDAEPLVDVFPSNRSGELLYARREVMAMQHHNPRNGTPWYRYTPASSAGQTNHSHFGGLTAGGSLNEDFLRAHNVVRANGGLPSVAWNSALQSLAETHLDKMITGGCYIEHSDVDERLDAAGFEYVGENLYKVEGMVPTGVDVVDAWYAELSDYTYGVVGDYCVKEKCEDRSDPPCILGHFTQVMWSSTTDIGCALRKCDAGAGKAGAATYISICQYGPGGNIVGELPFSSTCAHQVGLGMETCGQRRYSEHVHKDASLEPPGKEGTHDGRLSEHSRADRLRRDAVLVMLGLFINLRRA
mmetsp:Transcript_7078/g.17100  ORF Transcript_7078/g.17100 Transcript_7078/m.17100 type:complete len:333 (-) Transcript_7078:7-1005(-)